MLGFGPISGSAISAAAIPATAGTTFTDTIAETATLSFADVQNMRGYRSLSDVITTSGTPSPGLLVAGLAAEALTIITELYAQTPGEAGTYAAIVTAQVAFTTTSLVATATTLSAAVAIAAPWVVVGRFPRGVSDSLATSVSALAGLGAIALSGVAFNDTPVMSRGVYATLSSNIAFNDATPEAQTVFAVTLSTAIALSMTANAAFSETLRERLGITTPLSPNFSYHLEVASALVVEELMLVGVPVALAESVVLSCADAISRGVLMSEALGLVDVLAPKAVYGAAVTQSVHLVDLFRNYFGAEVADSIATVVALLSVTRAAFSVSETVAVTADLVPRLIMRATMADTLDVTADTVLHMLLTSEVIEGIELDLTYLSPGTGVTTWSMNTMTGAVSEYQNFAFNGFAVYDGQHWATSRDGLYELSGDSDDGANIIARLKGGFLQFGGTRLSRLKEVYVAARGGGKMILRIIAADDAEYVYSVDTRSMRSSKVHMGKGMRCRYFSYELITAGQDFELDSLEFVPIVMTRRV